MEEVVDWQMEILAQCMEECQPLFHAGREAGLLIGKNEKERGRPRMAIFVIVMKQ